MQTGRDGRQAVYGMGAQPQSLWIRLRIEESTPYS